MTKILYYIIYTLLYTIALLPFKVLYIVSDIFLYPMVYYICRYRRKIVKQNLKNSFPQKTDKERIDIEKEFYHHFCDYFLETIKLLHISTQEIRDRISFNNIELIKEQLDRKGSVIMMLGHYANWEWITSIGLNFDDNTKTAQIYRPLNNKAFDRIFLKIRSRFHSTNISKYKVLRTMVNIKQKKDRYLVGFMSDQSPSKQNIHYWTQFLNQDTPVYLGAERIAKKTDFAVMYLDVEKIGRGRYRCNTSFISVDPEQDDEFAITEKYIREMEKTISRAPAYWLWTHKRWKYQKEVENNN